MAEAAVGGYSSCLYGLPGCAPLSLFTNVPVAKPDDGDHARRWPLMLNGRLIRIRTGRLILVVAVLELALAYEILRQQELAGKAGAADRDCCRQAGANLPKGGEKLCARDVNADRLESHGFTRPALGKPSDVGADHIGQFGIATRGLPVGH